MGGFFYIPLWEAGRVGILTCAWPWHGNRPFTSHALRDTFATRYIEQGGNPQTLKTILGHSSYSITMDLYSQVLPNTKKQEMERIIIEI